MDRLSTKQPAVAAALLLIGAPACACDGAGVIIAANPDLEALLGTGVAGRSLLDFFARASIGPAAAMLRQAATTAQRWDAVLAAGGEEVAVQLGAKPLPLDAGGPGATIVVTDIRRFERHQAELRQALLEQKAILDNASVG
ncbi:MAG: PAS domain-containing protein, partial [Telluria sp.]